MRLALFDFDGTLFPKETIPFLVQRYFEHGQKKYRVVIFYIKTLWYLAKYKLLKQIDKVTFRKKAVVYFLELFDGESAARISEFFQKAAVEVVKTVDPVIVNEVLRLKKEGYHTVILSGCFSELLEDVAKAIGIDSVVGTDLCYIEDAIGNKVYKNGTYIDIIADERKVEAIKKRFKDADWNRSIAYADSCYDEPLLNLVGEKIAVNPDRLLTQIAKERKWKILKTDYCNE